MGLRQKATMWAEEVAEGPHWTFLGAQVVGVAALLLAVDSAGVQAGVTSHNCTSEWASIQTTQCCHSADKAPSQGGLFLDAEVWGSAAILQLFARKKSDAAGQAGCPPCLGFYFGILKGVTRLNLKGDGLASQGFHKDLQLWVCWGCYSTA